MDTELDEIRPCRPGSNPSSSAPKMQPTSPWLQSNIHQLKSHDSRANIISPWAESSSTPTKSHGHRAKSTSSGTMSTSTRSKRTSHRDGRKSSGRRPRFGRRYTNPYYRPPPLKQRVRRRLNELSIPTFRDIRWHFLLQVELTQQSLKFWRAKVGKRTRPYLPTFVVKRLDRKIAARRVQKREIARGYATSAGEPESKAFIPRRLSESARRLSEPARRLSDETKETASKFMKWYRQEKYKRSLEPEDRKLYDEVEAHNKELDKQTRAGEDYFFGGLNEYNSPRVKKSRRTGKFGRRRRFGRGNRSGHGSKPGWTQKCMRARPFVSFCGS